MDCINKTLDKWDALAYSQLERLHLSGDKEHTSSVGGFCTVCLFLSLVALSAWKGSQVFQYNGIYEYEGSLSPDEEIFVQSSQKYVFWLRDAAQPFDFDPTKLDVYIDHHLFEYDQEGNRTKTETRYDIRNCSESDFNNTKYERNYWQNGKQGKPYCIEDPDKSLSLLGTVNNRNLKKSWSQFILRVNRCNNQSTNAGTSQCSSEEEIDNWLEDKVLRVRLINSRLSLQPPYSFSLEQQFKTIATIPLSKDQFTRGGYYQKKKLLEDPTTFLGQFTQKPSSKEYVDIEEKYLNTFTNKKFNYSDPKYEGYEGAIAGLGFFNSPSTLKIKLKQTTRIGDLLSYIGGTMTSMLLVFRFMTKRYQTFNSDLTVYESLNSDATSTVFPFPDKKDDSKTEVTSKKSSVLQPSIVH